MAAEPEGKRPEEEEEVLEELRELLEEKEQEDPTTAREAFELEAEELGLSEEAGKIGYES